MGGKHWLLVACLAWVACGAAAADEKAAGDEPAAVEKATSEGKVLYAADFESGAVEPRPSELIGRFQLVSGVSGVPGEVMLLDTVTGMTWLLCEPEAGKKAWCGMARPGGV